MDIFSWLLLISFILLLFWKTAYPKQLPPGPTPLPVLGNLLHINFYNPLNYLKMLAQKYGPIFTLYMGGKPMVFVQGFPLVKEVLLINGTEFAGRPEYAILKAVHKKTGILLAPYGQAWKEQRKFSLMSLRNFGLGKKSMEEKILDEAAFLMQIFEENMDVPFDPLGFLESAVANIISTIVLGKHFKYDDNTLRHLLDLIHEHSKEFTGPWVQLYNAVPFVRRLPLPHWNFFNGTKKIVAFFLKEIEEHKATFVPGDHRDVTDAYLEEIQKPENKGSSFEEEWMIIAVHDLFIAGLETTATTLAWGLLYMMVFPEIQEKCQVEINNVLGNSPCIQYEDRDNLPYTNAVIHELQRFANVVPLGIPHTSIKDMQLLGYTIPKLAQKYGPIFTLYMGGKPMVFVQGFPLVKEVLLINGTEFAGRPEYAILKAVHKKTGILLAPYGQAWKEQRKFSLMSLRNFGLGKKSMEEKILDEAAFLMQIFEENMDVPFDPLGFLESAVANIISTIVLGKHFKYDDNTLRHLLDLIHEHSKEFTGPWVQLYNAVPFVRRLPLPHWNFFNGTKKIVAFFLKEIEEHKATFVPGDHRDVTDAYLEEIQKPENKGSSFEEEWMIIAVHDLFIAGLETTATTLAWGLLYMMVFPEIQEKCQVEINNVLGNSPCIQYEDRDNLPYTNAVIHELQRFANVVPLGIPHTSIKDMQLLGYTIPKDTPVVTSLISVHYDESQWKYPHEFNPSNFLNEKGEFVKPEAFLAFSAGPRSCLGENLARMELFLFFTNILRRFQILWPDETKAPDLTPNFGITQSPSRFKMALKHHQQI